MSEKRLSEGGDKVVLADAARVRRKLPGRSKQFPAIALFVTIVLALAFYEFLAP